MGQTHTTQLGPSLEERVAAELRAELARQDKSRRWLAARTGLALTSVARWVRGDGAVGLDELDVMARALGTTTPRLLAEAQRRGYRARPVKPDVEDRAEGTLAGGGLVLPGLPLQRSA